MSEALYRQAGLFLLLKELSELPGVSGSEKPVREHLARTLRGHVDEMDADALGNLIAVKRGDGTDVTRVAVMAHMDEVGLVVSGADEDGQLKFEMAGGINADILVAQRVSVGSENLRGVIGYKPIHLQSPQERDKHTNKDDLRVDIGAKDSDEALQKAPLGTPVSFVTKMKFAGLAPSTLPEDGRLPEKGRLMGKAFDDRLGCLALTALLRGPRLPFDLYGIFSVQEEVGLRGAPAAAWRVEPDIALILEGTVADDLPRKEDLSPTTRIGAGPAITVLDRHTITDPHLLRYFLAQAEAASIPLQLKQPGVGGTDAQAVQLVKGGVAVAILAVPTRYLHTPVSLFDIQDLINLLHLLQHTMPGLPTALANKHA